MSKNKKTKRVNVVDAVFNYTSVCCSKPAKKQALTKTEEAQGTLGHWRCTNCERPTKVTRSKATVDNGSEPEV